jgi:heat shock protein HslJ
MFGNTMATFSRARLAVQAKDDCMHWLMALLGFTVIVALADEPCMAGASSELSSLRGTYWRLERIDGAAEETSNVVIRITVSSVDFSVPCHFRLYPFIYSSSGSLIVSPRAAATSSCLPEWHVLGAVEANLPRINDYVVGGDDLTFLDKHGGPVMRLTRMIADGLENRTWSIAQYWDGNHLVEPSREASVAFMGGVVDGSPGCGGLYGRYKLSGTHLTAHLSWLLRGFCPGDYERQNADVVKALSGERLVEHDGGRAILRDDQGVVRVVLKP